METFYINQATYGGCLQKAYSSFATRNGVEAIWFPIKVQKADNQFGYVNVMCYSRTLQDRLREFIIPANIGKRLIVQGETIFPIKEGKAVMLNLKEISFIDDFIANDDSPDFSED